jgi:hypothetical protein
MAIYSARRSRWPLMLAVAVAALVVGLIAGALLFGNKPLDLAAAGQAISAQTSASAGLLEVVEIEYTEAAGSNFTGTELQAALDNLARSRERFDSVSAALRQIDAPRVAQIEGSFEALEGLLNAHADVATVHSAIVDLTNSLTPR